MFLFSSPSLHAQLADELAVLAPHRPIAPRLAQPLPWHSPATKRSMIGGLWMTDPYYHSYLHLRNDVETSAITVTPNLYLSNGMKYKLRDVTLEPAGTAVIDINDALAHLGVASWAALSGYVEIEYTWPWDALCVTVRNVDPVHSEQFNYGLISSVPPKVRPNHPHPVPLSAFEGLWWKQERNVTGFVAISNFSGNDRNIAIDVTDSSGNSIGTHMTTVGPHETKTIILDELSTAPSHDGGLHVRWNGNASDILVNGGLEDQAVGYSANIPFVALTPPDQPMPIEQRISEVGLMTGLADPMMRFRAGTTFTAYSVLRNVADQPVSVTPRLYWMRGGAPHSAAFAPFSISPQASWSLNVPSLMQQAGLQGFSGSVNLILDTKGPQHALIAAAGSVDQSNTYVFAIAPSIIKESIAKSLSYWSTGNGDDTMITLWNPASEAQDFIFTLFFSGGQYNLPLHIEGRATR